VLSVRRLPTRLIDRLVRDVVAETERRLAAIAPKSAEDVRLARKPTVSLSQDISVAEKALRRFLNTRLYRDYRVNRMTSKARRIVANLFGHFMAEPETLPTEWQALITEKDVNSTRPRVIADYIAGMTDRFAIAEHTRLFDLHES